MDIVVIMFGSVIATMTALTFLEVRKIRKLTEGKKVVPAATAGRSSEPPVRA